MPEFVLSPAASKDIFTILEWTEEKFGEAANLRYQKLLAIAITDVAKDPELVGSVDLGELKSGYRTYHLFHSRKKAARKGAKVREPRHLLLYRINSSGNIEISRVLHDSMELREHLPGQEV